MASTKARRFVAFLRGINVGHAKRVAMEDLRSLVHDLGYTEVRTLLNSGNVVFSVPGGGPEEAAARIEASLRANLGVSARATVVEAGEIVAAVEANPMAGVANDPSRLIFAVLARPADRARLAPLLKKDWSPEAIALDGRFAWLWCPKGFTQSRLVEAVGKAVGDASTMRNLATMRKLSVLAAGR